MSDTEDHGDCPASEDWMRRTVTDAGLSLLNYSEAAWLSQDVIAAWKGDQAGGGCARVAGLTWALGLDQPIGPQDTVVAYREGIYRNVLS